MRSFRRSLGVLVTLASFCLPAELHAQAVFSWPLDTPVSVSLESTPIVTLDGRTIDFTPNLNQQFINFFFVERLIGYLGTGAANPIWRIALGIRARDGLVSLTGNFPSSHDPSFVNQVPAFTPGTTDLLLFDVEIVGFGVPFSATLIDRDGDSNSPMFQTAAPEPGTLVLFATGFGALVGSVRRRRSGNRECRPTRSLPT